jgi:hypothetical protein
VNLSAIADKQLPLLEGGETSTVGTTAAASPNSK